MNCNSFKQDLYTLNLWKPGFGVFDLNAALLHATFVAVIKF